jgi:hypothetical protein
MKNNTKDDCCKGCLNGAPGANPSCKARLLINKEAQTGSNLLKNSGHEN